MFLRSKLPRRINRNNTPRRRNIFGFGSKSSNMVYNSAKDVPEATLESKEVMDQIVNFINENQLSDAKALAERAASKQNGDAMLFLGKSYIYGYLDEKNDARGHRLVENAARLGAKGSISQLAYNYKNGYGVSKDEQKYIKYLKEAADKDDADGMVSLAIELRKGDLVEYDPKKAFDLFHIAAKKHDNKQALLALAKAYFSGGAMCGKNITKSNAATNMVLHMDPNDPMANYLKGMYYALHRGDAKRAFKHINTAAEYMFPPALLARGKLYLEGNGCEKNIEWGIVNIKDAAKKKYPPALGLLGKYSFYGTYMDEDKVRGWNLLLASAQRGDLESCEMVGDIYAEGNIEANIDMDKETAIKYYKVVIENNPNNKGVQQKLAALE